MTLELFAQKGYHGTSISQIAQKAKINLRSGGYLYFEINEEFGEQICALLSEEGYQQIELFTDIHDRPRNIKAVLK